VGGGGVNTQNNTPDNEIRQKYFLLSKRWTVALVLLALVTYGCAVIWSEFVFSVSTSSPRKLMESSQNTANFHCSDISKFDVEDKKMHRERNPWLFEKFRTHILYSDALLAFPQCLSASVIWTQAGPHDTRFYYVDIGTNKPVVKVTIESID
jgi:hypothetical protein